MWKKNDNMGSKSGYKRKLLSREKEGVRKKNWKVQILAYGHARKQKKPCLITSTET